MAQISMPRFFWPTAERQALDEYIASTSDRLPSNDIFTVDRVIASYVISGNYGLAPRIIFYVLVLVSILSRRSFLVSVALGSAMIYSSTAALHAIVLAAMASHIVPRASLDSYGTVQVKAGITIPVIPGVIEADTDAVFAIVGTSFMALAPMLVWSSTFRSAKQRAILVMWSVFLFVGLVCSWVSGNYVYFWSFPQLRFCPVHLNDTFPITYSGSGLFGGAWDHSDRNHWNDTVAMFFQNTTIPRPNACYYPSMDFTWPLRNPDEILITPDVQVVHGWVGFWLVIAWIIVISLSAISSVVIILLRVRRERCWYNENEKYSTQIEKLKNAIRVRPIYNSEAARAIWKATLAILIHVVDTYAKYLSGIALVMYLA